MRGTLSGSALNITGARDINEADSKAGVLVSTLKLLLWGVLYE